MKANRLLIATLVIVMAGLTFNQWRLQRAISLLNGRPPADAPTNTSTEDQSEQLRDAEARLKAATTQLQIAEQRLAQASAQLAQLEQTSRQTDILSPRRQVPSETTFSPVPDPQELEGDVTNAVKRSWGPEQATGEPDTFQAGDISTAWAPLAQDGGEEWLKLDYERTVEIAEVRVRETHNPGAVSKITAFLANGSEITLWEGVEPKSEPPVEMSFQIPASVNAQSVKVYLDTKRVPGWNEIDAVQIVGRDGSQQWARHATASSSYAVVSAPRPMASSRAWQ